MTESKPTITRTTHVLSIERLEPGDFERLCCALLPREGFDSPQHYGAAGSEQGRDIVARRGGELWYVQCKQVKECGPKVLLDEVEKVRGLMERDPDRRPAGILFMVSCDVSATARDRVGKRCAELGLACEIWARTDLDTRVQNRPDIVARFFSGQASIETTATYTEGGAYIEGQVDTGDGDFIGRDQHIHYHVQSLPSGAPFQAPLLPAHFVPRPEVSTDLKARLLTDETAAPGALVISAVHGLGGIGKTTLVAALAHDPEVQVRFPDGVLWVTLGQQPELLARLHEWIQNLHDYDFRPTTADGAVSHLRTLLHDKACLLVIDDAWQADHLRTFLVGGPRCLVLITTRDAALARKMGARLYDLDVMTEAQALALFEARLGPLDGNREQAAALARELGYLPLALELAAAQVEGGIAWAELLDIFRKELADLAVLELDEATYRNESLRLSFLLSLERLTPEDQEAFAWLGVLPEDVRLNPTMAATLWDQPGTDTRKRLHRLRDKALLKSVGEDRYMIHDLLHDEAKLRLAERMPLADAHAALLARYRVRCRDIRRLALTGIPCPTTATSTNT
jgi:hypothetical protein